MAAASAPRQNPVKHMLKEGLMLVDVADGMLFRQVGAAVNQTLQFGAEEIPPHAKIARDCGDIFDAHFQHRRLIGAEVNALLRGFEKRQAHTSDALTDSLSATKASAAKVEPCGELLKERMPLVAQHVRKVEDAVQRQIAKGEEWEVKHQEADRELAHRLEAQRAALLEAAAKRRTELDEWAKAESAALQARYSLETPPTG